MARSYGRIACSIWDDDDEFMELSPGAQRTYLMLASQKDVSACGTLPLTIRRWAARIKPGFRDQLGPWLNELRAHRFIVMDTQTEELLIRTFVKWDGGYGNEKRRKAIHATSMALRSPILRRVLAVEMIKVDLEPQFSTPEPVSADGYPIDGASDGESIGAGIILNPESFILNPESGNLKPGASGAGKPAAPPAPKSKRGTRIPDDFTITDEMRGWAKTQVPGLDINRITDNFVDFWRAKAGQNATKLDWESTWRKWMRDDFDQRPPPHQHSTNGHAFNAATQRSTESAARVHRLAEQENHHELGTGK